MQGVVCPLRQERLRKPWTQQQLADFAQVSLSTVERAERGDPLRFDNIQRLCTCLEKSPEQLGLLRVENETDQVNTTEDDASGQVFDQQLNIPSISNRSKGRMFSHSVSQDLFSLGIMALVVSQQQNGWSLEELHYMIDKEMKQYNNVEDGTTRRDACKFLISVPLAFLNIQGTAIKLAPSESLPLFSAGIPACWYLYYNGGDLKEIGRTIGTYLRQVEPLVQSSHHEGMAANLTSQSYQLASMLSVESEDYNTAIAQAKHAIDYAKLATDPNVHAAAILRKAVVLYSQKRYWQMNTVLQSAMPIIKKASPLMRVRIYSELGAALALNGQDEALRYVQMAIDMCPDNVEADPAYSYIFASPSAFYLNQGIAYTNLGQHKNAWQALQNAESRLDAASSMRRWEIITNQATAAIAMGNLDLSAEKIESAIQESKTLHSDLWVTDVEQIYQQLQNRWRNEQKVKDVGELLESCHH